MTDAATHVHRPRLDNSISLGSAINLILLVMAIASVIWYGGRKEQEYDLRLMAAERRLDQIETDFRARTTMDRESRDRLTTLEGYIRQLVEQNRDIKTAVEKIQDRVAQ